MDRLIKQVLDAYDDDLLAILEAWNVSFDDVLDALDQTGFIDLVDILTTWQDDEDPEEA